MPPKPRTKATMDAEAVARMMAAQEHEEIEALSNPAPRTEAAPSDQATVVGAPIPFDPGKIDGRTLRRTGREPFATRIKPEAHEALRRIAYNRRITIAEALEMAVAAFERS